MMDFFTTPYGLGMQWLPFGGSGLALLALWSLVWKGLALWHSAERRQPWWFIVLLLVNTIGILDIVYLFAVAKIKPAELFSKRR